MRRPTHPIPPPPPTQRQKCFLFLCPYRPDPPRPRPRPLRFPVAFAPFGTAGFELTPHQEYQKKIRDERDNLRQRQRRGHAPS